MDKEIEALLEWVNKIIIQLRCQKFEHGGKGGVELAKRVIEVIEMKKNIILNIYMI